MKFAETVCVILIACSMANSQWEPEIRLSTSESIASLNENMGRCVVADGDSVHAVWAEFKGTDRAIFYKHSKDKGVTWGADTRLSGNDSADTMPLLAVSSSTVHVVFLRNGQTPQSASYYKRSTDGGVTWGPDVPLGNSKWWPGVAAAGAMVCVSLNSMPDGDNANSVVSFRRSIDNGATWEPPQQISHAPVRKGGRAEDPAIVADGKYVHLVWNDNRDAEPRKGMSVYYRRSADMGVTWSPETPLTQAPEYAYFPSIELSGSHVDIVYGDRQGGRYHVHHMNSTDNGTTWGTKRQLSNSPDGELYPAIARDGSNVHVAWIDKQGIMYTHSNDGGTTWEPTVNLVTKGTIPYICLAGDTLHMIFVSQRDGHATIYYKRNPTGNKKPASP